MHLPAQLAEVDPIVASFCGGAVGVLSTLLVVEVNNAKLQAKTRCVYCEARTEPSKLQTFPCSALMVHLSLLSSAERTRACANQCKPCCPLLSQPLHPDFSVLPLLQGKYTDGSSERHRED